MKLGSCQAAKSLVCKLGCVLRKYLVTLAEVEADVKRPENSDLRTGVIIAATLAERQVHGATTSVIPDLLTS